MADTRTKPVASDAARFQLQRNSGTPLYVQIKNQLLAEIQNSKLPEGALVPTEDELCRMYRVSKITVREALRVLVREGILERTRGKGTFVRRLKYEPHLGRLFSFTKWASENGFKPSTRVVRIDTDVRNDLVAAELGISPRKPFVRIDRLRLADDEPLCFEQIYIASSLSPDIHLKDVANRRFNEILASDYGIALKKTAVSIEAGAYGAEGARLLKSGKATPILVIKHKIYADDSKVAYIVVCHYRGDRVKFVIEF